MKCPNCGEENRYRPHMRSGKEFRCQNCAAVLRLPRIGVRLLLLTTLTFLVGFTSFCLIVAALTHEHPTEVISFQSHPILTVVFGITVILSLAFGAFTAVKMKLQVVRLAQSCGNCGSIISIDNAHFCPRCGVGLGRISKRLASRHRQVGAVEIRRVAPRDEHVGICMVCEEVVKASDIATWCPNCGGVAHKPHLLEYLHVHDQCPACGNHLDEKEMRQSF